MKVSVCIPTYNRPDLLEEAIGSCLAQTHPPYEIVIGDDSKNDESYFLVREIEKKTSKSVRFVYLKNTPSLGQTANVNKLIDNATGDKFVLLHDDDLLLPDALEVMSSCFEKNPAVDVVYGKQQLIEDDGTLKDDEVEDFNACFFRTKSFEGNRLSSLEASMLQQFPNNGYMIEMDIVKKIKYRDKAKVGDACDFDFGLRLGQSGYNFWYVDHFTAQYRLSKTSVLRNSNGSDAGYQAFRMVSDILCPKNTRIYFYQDAWLRKKSSVAIVSALSVGKRKEAWKIYFSKWHRGEIFSLGGGRRLINLLLGYRPRLPFKFI